MRDLSLRVADSFTYYVVGFYRRVRDEHLLFYASGIAFHGILCVIPFLLLSTSLLGIILSSSDLAISRVNEVLNTVFPSERYAQEIKRAVELIVDDVIRHKSSYGFVGLAILTWTSTSLFSAMRTVMNAVYRINTRKLAIIKILEQILLVIILAILFFISNVFIWMFSFVRNFASTIPLLHAMPVEFFSTANSFLVSYVPGLVMFFLLNRFVPDKGITPRIALIAALITTLLWWIAGRMFLWYISTFHSYSVLYGAYAFLLVFIFWVYYSSIAFIAGVIIAQLYRERRMMKKPL